MENSKKMNRKKLLPALAIIVVSVLLLLVAIFIGHWKSVSVARAKGIPKIEGQTELVLNEGYDETETSEYTVQGGTVSIVSDTTGGKAVWNEETSKLLIQPGLTSNSSVTLEVSNGNAVENDTITLYITITHDPYIKGPKECFLDAGYKASQSGIFAVYGKDVAVSITDESKTGLISWNNAERKLDIAPGLKLGTYKVILTASNGNIALDSEWECVITVGKKCTVTGSYAYNSQVNAEDKVTVKIGDYVAEINAKTKSFECLVPNGYYDIVFSSEFFKDVKKENVHITNNTKLGKVMFDVPLLTPETDFEYANYEKSGMHYTIWKDRCPSPVGLSTTKGFTATVSMRPFNYEWGLNTRGVVGVKVGNKSFYIMPRFTSKDGNKISLYVSDKIVGFYDVTAQHCLGDTGQTYQGDSKSGLKCTMQLTYLNGNYYISLTTEGCTDKPNVLVLNQSTSGLGAEYFGAGKRTVQLASLNDFMYSYSDFSYAIGDAAAKAVVGNVKLCTVTGSYSYASGTSTSEGYKNRDDKVQVQFGPYKLIADVNKQTYKAVIPKGTYDVTLTSKLFRDVTVSSVNATGTTNVPNAMFTVPKMTPTTNFEYANYAKSGMHYTVWKNVGISPSGMETEEGFTATVSMRPFNYEWGLNTRGVVGVKVGDKTFYIMPRFDTKNDNKISLYVSDKIVGFYDVTAQHCLGDTGQRYTGDLASGLKCTMQLTYLHGNYYVSLTTEGCTDKPNVLVVNQSTSGLGAEYFGAGKRTVQLASLWDFMYSYSDLSYAIGDDAAKAVVGDIELCAIEGSYSYTSGTYTSEGCKNKDDEVQIQIGHHQIVPDANTQTYKAVIPKGTYDITLTSKMFRDVTVSSVNAVGTTNVPNTEFTVPKMTPTGDYSYSKTSGYAVYNGKKITPVDMMAEGGFTTSVTMRPYSAGRCRGNIGISVAGNTFYIIPVRDKDTKAIDIYVSEKIIDEWDYTDTGINAIRVGGTGQILESSDASGKCTLQLTYLDGNYYVTVQIPGTNTTSPVFVLNAHTTGLDEKYFASGTRQVLFSAFKGMMCYYTDINYQIGDDAAKAVVGDIELCTIEGTYSYASGTYTSEGNTNKDDKVQIQIGHYQIAPDVNTQTYKAVIPKGTYDITLTSKMFRDVTVSSVNAKDTTNVPNTEFTVPKMTLTGDYSYSETSGYAVYNGKTIKPVDMTAEGGFTITSTMRPYTAGRCRGNIGISVEGNTFYIIPVRDKDTKSIDIYVSTKIVDEWAYAGTGINATRVGGTGQVLETSDATSKCTLKLAYLNGNYYVSVQIPGKNTTSSTVVLNAQSTGLDAKYFASGTRQIQFCAFKTMMAYYTDITYQIGDEAAEEFLNAAGITPVSAAKAKLTKKKETR